MTFIICPECEKQLSDQANDCPGCGAPMKKKSGFVFKLVVSFVALFLVLPIAGKLLIAQKSPDALTMEKNRLKPVVDPAFREAYAEEMAKINGLSWRYDEFENKMGRGMIKLATVNSSNEMEFAPPYQGPQRARFNLRQHPEWGKQAYLIIERGQFICRSHDCEVLVRFDDAKPVRFKGANSADYDSTTLFIDGTDLLIESIKSHREMFIEAQFYQEGRRIFEFDISDFKG